MLHLPVKSPELPFQLLHAKVAVLGFQGLDRFLLRVIVTTGNWTRQTLEESLDLAWHIDVANKAEDNGHGGRQARPDRSGRRLVFPIVGTAFFDTRSLDLEEGSNESTAAAQKVAAWAPNWVGVIADTGRGSSTTEKALCFGSFPISSNFTRAPRPETTWLSGLDFTREPRSGIPNIPKAYSRIFRERGLLTASCDKNIFVNPRACQSIATGRSWIEEQGLGHSIGARSGLFRRSAAGAPCKIHFQCQRARRFEQL